MIVSIQLNSIQLFFMFVLKTTNPGQLGGVTLWLLSLCLYQSFSQKTTTTTTTTTITNTIECSFHIVLKQPIPDSWAGEHRGYCSSHMCGIYCIGKGVSYPFTPLRYVPMWCPGTHDCVTRFAPSPWVSNHKGDTFLRVCVVMGNHVDYLSWYCHFS